MDALALNEILKQYIETPITLEYETPSAAEMETTILSVSHNYPFIVIENDDEVVGFAYAHLNLEQPGLSWNAELRAFISLKERGQGFGSTAMNMLIDILKLQNVRNVYSIVTEGNPRSEKLHRKLGFSLCGTQHKTGFKNGRWLDVNLYERRLTEDGDGTPQPFVPFNRVDKEKLQAIFDKVNAELAAR